jgi:integrase
MSGAGSSDLTGPACSPNGIQWTYDTGTCTALWVSPKGGALSYVGIVKSFHRLSNRLGVHIAPHDARDAAATTWAISAPEQIGVARDLLAHGDLRTTTKHYNRARGIEASRTYSQVIAGIRRKNRSA